MYADPARLRADARALAQAGSELDAQASGLVTTADTARWESSAADAMRRRIRHEAALLRGTATEFADAASALLQHAAAVEAVQLRIATVEHAAQTLARAALRGATSLLTSAFHGTEELVRRLRTVVSHFPPPGHHDWLDVPEQLRRLGLPRAG